MYLSRQPPMKMQKLMQLEHTKNNIIVRKKLNKYSKYNSASIDQVYC